MTDDEYVYMWQLCTPKRLKAEPFLFYRCLKCQEEYNSPSQAGPESLKRWHRQIIEKHKDKHLCDGHLEVIIREYNDETDQL